MIGSGLGRIKVGPDAITRIGPPSLRDARDWFATAKKGKTPCMQRVMRDSNKTEAERLVQLQFSKNRLLPGAILALSILLFRAELSRLPNRIEVGSRTVPLRYEPVALDSGSVGPFRIVGAWRLLVDDPRFGGISALAVDGRSLIAISDSAVVARFPKPGLKGPRVSLVELPAGPGRAGFKVNRDSEALLADPKGRGWWVAFENRDELWLYDRRFGRALQRLGINASDLGRNRGIEGMVAGGEHMLLFPERGGRAIQLDPVATGLISGMSGWLSDAVRLPSGAILVVNRRPTPIGLSNSLVALEAEGVGYRARRHWPIPVGRLDNVEALAAEPIAGGGVRLWMMTDNNLQQRRPTLLLALELRPQPAR